MTSSPIARRGFTALLAGFSLLLAACGSNNDDDTSGTAQWRILNLNAELPSADIYTGTDRRFAAVAADQLTNYDGISSGSYTVRITAAGSATSLLSSPFSLSKDRNYTGIVWGRSGSVKFATLPENDDTAQIGTGNARIRVYNATADAGTFDIYLTQSGANLEDETPIAASGVSATLGGYKELSSGDYRLRVTASGDPSDIRLDVPVLTLTEKTYSTLVLTAGPGGVLLNGTHVLQQGAVTLLKNTQARLRTVASANTNAVVAVRLDSTTFSAGLRSPTVGSYQRVTAGARTVDVLVNGANVSSVSRTLAAGGDYTLLVYGTNGVTLVTDDNRLASAGRYRMRLINGAAGTDPLSLLVDFATFDPTNDIAPGAASGFFSGTANSSARVDVSSTSGSSLVYSDTDVNLQTGGVYTMFVLGGNTAPTGILRKDR
jgi:hypothetical protein